MIVILGILTMLLTAWLVVVLYNTRPRPVRDRELREQEIKALEQAAGMCPQCLIGWTDPITGYCDTCKAVTGPDHRQPILCPYCGICNLDLSNGYCGNCCRHWKGAVRV